MLAFIIFGTRGVRSTIKEGQFNCPQCMSERNYKHKKVTQFFTLYFIPLIPLSNKGTYVECQSCKNTYIEGVLDMGRIIREKERATSVEQIQNRLSEPATPIATMAASSTSPVTETAISAKVDILSEKQKAVKKLLIMMILADGKVEDSEIHMFHKVYKDVANAVVADMFREINTVKLENKLPHQYLKEVSSFLNDEGKRDIIKASMMIAAADGDIDPSEIRMVENFGRSLEMRPAEVKEIIAEITG